MGSRFNAPEMGSLSSKNVNYLLCVVDMFTKYAFVKPLKDKKAKTIFNGFIGIESESKRKPNKLWVDQGKVFCNNPMQKWLDVNNILIYSIHNKGNSVVTERLITAKDSKFYLG